LKKYNQIVADIILYQAAKSVLSSQDQLLRRLL